MEYYHDNMSIECMEAEVISRRIQRSAYREVNNIGNCTIYKCSQNSEAKILNELVPKVALHNLNSKLDLNTVLKSENLYVAVKSIKILRPDVINHSGRHKAQIFSTKHFTFAQITRQLASIPQLVPPIQIISPADK